MLLYTAHAKSWAGPCLRAGLISIILA